MALHAEINEKVKILTDGDLDIYERSLLADCENDIENLKADIEGKKRTLSYLTEQLGTYKMELEARDDLDNNYIKLVKENVDEMNKKKEILEAYLSVMYSEEFQLNKVKREVEDHAKRFWLSMKPTMDSARELQKDLATLKELVEKRNELELKTNTLMNKKNGKITKTT